MNNTCFACGEPANSEDFCAGCGRYNTAAADSAPPEGVDGFRPDKRGEYYLIDRSWYHGENRWGAWGCIGVMVMVGFGAHNMYLETERWNCWLLGFLVFMLYPLAACLFNRTAVLLRRDRLEVKRGPLYMPLATSYAVPREEMKRFDQAKFKATFKGSTTISYPLSLLTRDGERLDVFSFDQEEQAKKFYRYLISVYGTQ
ncbi:MAG: hypothetical protein ABIJ96_09700 [Elusimicrobiota bacterium]